jgi:hypothetical protein
MTKDDLPALVAEALRATGGGASITSVSRFVWDHYESDLRLSGDLFYTWQYDLRWAAHRLRVNGTMCPAKASPTGIWELQE